MLNEFETALKFYAFVLVKMIYQVGNKGPYLYNTEYQCSLKLESLHFLKWPIFYTLETGLLREGSETNFCAFRFLNPTLI